MSDETGYNGWTNYETWSVSLIVNNDEGLQDEAHEIVRRCYAEHEAREGYGATLEGSVSHYLREWVEEWISTPEQYASDEGPFNAFAYLWAQLLGATMGEVNWYEIAANLCLDVEEIVSQ